jgi:hypothetical protein
VTSDCQLCLLITCIRTNVFLVNCFWQVCILPFIRHTCLCGYLLLTLAVILMIRFWMINTLLLSVDFPQDITLYDMIWNGYKRSKLIFLKYLLSVVI